jgi:hypothetical protein
MAARLNTHHSELTRQKIQAGNLVQRIQAHAMGEIEMTSTQLKAAEILLDRSVAKLSQIQHVGPDGGAVQLAWPIPQNALDQP